MIYILKKIINLFITLFFVSFITFFTFQTLKGDTETIILGPEADCKQIEALKRKGNLEKNIFKRYLNWSKNAIKGDLGKSIRFNKNVKEMIIERLPITLFLTFLTLLLICIITTFLGFIIIKYNNTFISKLVLIISQIMLSIPHFLIAIIISLTFGIILNLFPVYVNSLEIKGNFKDIINLLWYLFMPAISLALGNIALIIRFLKNFLDEQLKMDYVKNAISKGISKNRILFKHILKNFIINIITIFGLIISDIIAGSIIIENIFSISGIGTLLTTSISTRDFVLLQGLVLYISFFIIIINFIIDILYKLIDPRI